MAENNIFSCRSLSTLSNIIGNTTSEVRNFIINLFPKGYFRSVYTDTMLASLEMGTDDTIKKELPILIIRPRVVLDDNTMSGRPFDWQFSTYFLYKKMRTNYFPVLGNDEDEIYIYAIPSRIRVDFEIEILTKTKMQQINTAFFLKQSVRHNAPFFLDGKREGTLMEIEVPKKFIKVLHDVLERPQTNDFEDYLKRHSMNYITRKTRLSSGNESYFYSYNTNLLCNFEGYPSIDDGNQQGQIKKDFKVSSVLSVKFTTFLNMMMESSKPYPKEFFNDLSTIIDDDLLSDSVFVHFTIKTRPNETRGDKTLYKWNAYITDTDELDVLPFGDLIDEDVMKVIEYYRQYSLDFSRLFSIVLFKDGLEIVEEETIVDWDKLTLTNVKPIKDYTYHFGIYVDLKELHEKQIKLAEIRG